LLKIEESSSFTVRIAVIFSLQASRRRGGDFFRSGQTATAVGKTLGIGTGSI
jgi:hypothetical protein